MLLLYGNSLVDDAFFEWFEREWHLLTLLVTQAERRTMISMAADWCNDHLDRQMNISQTTVSTVWQRSIPTGSCARLVRSGCPKQTTLREDRVPKGVVWQKRFLSLGTINRVWSDRIGKVVSQSTARIRLHSRYMYNRVARRKSLIGRNKRRTRIRWCTRVTKRNTQDNWSGIVFSDESRFNLGLNDGRMGVWLEYGTTMEPVNIAGFTRCSVYLIVYRCVSYHEQVN